MPAGSDARLRVIDALLVVALAGQALAIAHLYFFFDDFYFLDKAIAQPLAHLLGPQERFTWRPLSQYGFFALGFRLFGAGATGYFLLSLAILASAALAVPGIARFLGFDALEARLGAALFLVSPPALACLSWLSFVQQSLDVMFLLFMLRLEVLWLERGGAGAKVLAIACFALGLASNSVVVVGLPLLALLYVRRALREPASPWPRLARGWLACAIPCLVLTVAFVAVARTSPAWGDLRAGMSNPTHPYFVRMTATQALGNLGRFAGMLVPYGAASVPVWIALLGGLGARWLTRRRAGRPLGEEMQVAGLALAWIGVSLAPFLFLANRINPTMALLAAAAACPLLARLLLQPAAALGARISKPALAFGAGLALLVGHTALAWNHLAHLETGATQRAGLARIRGLAREHFPAAHTLRLVNDVAPPRPAADPVFSTYGYGSLPPALVDGRRVVFPTWEADQATGARKAGGEASPQEDAVIHYRNAFHFYVRPAQPDAR